MFIECVQCMYWKPTRENRGYCRRHAPRPALAPLEHLVYWPETFEYEGCGEGEPEKTSPGGQEKRAE